MSNRLGKLLASLAIVSINIMPVFASTTINDPSIPSGFVDLGHAIATIFSFVILLAGIIFIILFLVGGIQYLTAAGNEEQTGKAKRLLVDSIVGLVIVLASFAIGTFVINKLGVGTTVNDTNLRSTGTGLILN